MGNLGLGVILVGVFIVGFMFSWSLRHAFNLTVWFGAGWMGTLLLLYIADMAGYGYISVEPLGSGGAVAIGVATIVAWFYHRRWQKEERIRKAREAAERAARRKSGKPEPTMLGNVFRAVQKMRSTNGR
ncbi:MAG: hypothetical protein ACOC9Y_08845 [Chloroflexota bacterium]